MYNTCVFDLDGTIADTLNSIAYFGNDALAKFDLPPIPTDRYKYLVGNGYKILVHRMLAEVGRPEDDPVFPELAEYYHETYDKNSLYLTTPFPGMAELLKELKARGMKLAVLSNKPHTAVCNVVSELYGDDTFDLCYGQSEGTVLKPDPTMLLNILSELKAQPSECVYVGDTATDMETGKNAGAYTVGVLWGFREKDELVENGADRIVSEPCEILKIIEGK